ncbi:hypothetical protein QCA50_013740 [Cerrena zonata]|uniref:Amidase n=1 Tax=Cerrena zonata TaxID=2478898 RepID=A0AAW0FPU7_9APHY
MKDLGATIVDPADLPSADELVVSNNQSFVLLVDLKMQLEAYFEDLVENPSGVRSIADLVAFNDAHPDLEKPSGFEDQSILVMADSIYERNSTYFEALAFNKELGATRGIDAALQEHNLDALILPAQGLATIPASSAGYPIVTVPMGFFTDNVTQQSAGPETVYPAPGVPIGLSFLGTAYSEMDLISFAFAYEQKTQTRLKRKAFAAAIPKTQLADIIGK